MIYLRKNLKDFIRQVEKLAEIILNCHDEEKLYIYIRTYRTLCFLYNINSTNSICVEEIDKNEYYNDLLDRLSLKYFNEVDNLFLDEKDNLKELFSKNLFSLIDCLERFSNSSYYKCYGNLLNKKINSLELYDIFLNFLKEENKEMLDLFKELVFEKRIFRLKDKKTIEENALSIFNPLEQRTNILIRKDMVNLSYLDAYVHELAHAYDIEKMKNKSNAFQASIHNTFSNLSESLSTAYTFKVYEYLIKNSIYEEEAVISLANTLLGYSFSMDAATLVCALTREDYLKVSNEIPTKRDIIDLIKNNSKDFLVDDDADFLDDKVVIGDVVAYTYGYLISKTLVDKKNLDDFFEIRDQYPTIEQLKLKGFDLDSDSKVLIKHLEDKLD